MRRLTILLFFSLFTANFGASAHGQSVNYPGGRGLLHTASAWNLERGGITVMGYSSSYFKNARLTNADGTLSGVTYWDLQGVLSLHYASGRHVEWVLNQIVYQDSHKGSDQDAYNLPDDLILKMKIGSIGAKTSRAKFGFVFGMRLPLAAKDNLVLEPYRSRRVEGGLTALFSYSPDPLIPESAFNFHLNIGLWYHNDTGTDPIETPENNFVVIDPTTRFLYSIGFAFPVKHFDFSLELSGQNFFNRPPVTAYGREDFIYLTPGIKYRPNQWVTLLAGLDLRLSDFEDTSFYQNQGGVLPRINEALPNYPFWRLRTGIQFHLIKPAPQIPPTIDLSKVGNNGKREARIEKAQRELEERLIEQYDLTRERLETESAEAELERIREERKRLEAIIARLKRVLNYGDATEEPEKKTPPGQEQGKNLSKKKPQ